jgi:hypothetical protein
MKSLITFEANWEIFLNPKAAAYKIQTQSATERKMYTMSCETVPLK